ncbi:MAG TPA: pyridoxamine 5'-phosphate oxidase family protein [Capillimicrobium sp.]|nr:pyridoxamine 5'-phosphate oxidase family protein [Capillimicrobium sp.]
MASTFEVIDDHLSAWIARQPMFFVATAPLAADGHVNVSPKGPIGTFAVLGPRQVAYLDFFGSGAETIAHLRENGRIVVMLCAFEGPPQIIRLHGTGRPVWPEDPAFGELLERAGFSGLTGVEEARRAVIVVDVARISTSCGYGVPLMEPAGEREHFDLSKRKRLRTLGSDGLLAFQAERNAVSLDGLPAVRR